MALLTDGVLYALIFYVGMAITGSLLIYLFAKRVHQGLWSTHVMGLAVWIFFLLSFVGALELSFYPQPIILPLNDLIGKSVGGAMITLGFAIIFWAWRVYEFSYERITAIKVDVLFTFGPYKYTRNPQYLGLCLIFCGLTLFLNSFYFLIYCLLMTVGLYFIALIEEEGLKRKFGEKYLEYTREVPRFIPKLKYRSKPELDYLE